MRIPVVMMFIAATSLSINADARGRGGGGKSYSPSSSSSFSFGGHRKSYSTPSHSQGYVPSYAPSAAETTTTSTTAATTAAAASAAAIGTAAVIADKPEAPAATRDYYVQYDMEYSMDQPARDANTVRELALGEKVRVHERSLGWSRISPPGKPEEWVLSHSLGSQKVVATQQVQTARNPPARPSTALSKYQTGDHGANVTTRPFRSLQAARRLAPKERVVAYEEVGDWARISPDTTTTEEWVIKSDLIRVP
ncbi:SH3 domain-containing protein [Azotobacter beijerinckii]|uniref:SH3 domain-containing protein n=1 Tax=Azotobacter beijerinckii TaxID=170623 RepID=A0A1I4G330_9GAMM|nr:SH3 domain-containing protein [Azotobacter beijerinckii]SFL23900.1 hypothetical protein SAMN04244574_03645 [Azotobacter beijerinckii]